MVQDPLEAHAGDMWRARVMLGAPVGLLDYRVPSAMQPHLQPGDAVTVPLGQRRMGAYVVKLERGPHPDGIVLKDILAVDGDRMALPAAVLDLLLFAADYYRATAGDMLAAALPKTARTGTLRYRLTAHAAPFLADAATQLPNGRPLSKALHTCLSLAPPAGFTLASIEKAQAIIRAAAAQKIRTLRQHGLIEIVEKQQKRQMVQVFSRAPELPKDACNVLGGRQQAARQLFAMLPSAQAPCTMAELEEQQPGARSRMAVLLKHGLALRSSRAVEHLAYPDAACQAAQGGIEVVPTAPQQAALATLCAAIDSNSFAAYLLHAVTGSGKTEVYLRAVAHALAAGRQALVLVPEIALTPQLGERFRSRFGERVATFHSGLTEAERRDEWERVHRGEATIGLGARSALFLPLTHLGVIIVDEEHETSFKQDETPRYHARDLAVVRARNEGAVVVLGSATPSLETHHNASAGRYTRLVMPGRVAGRPLPEVTCINLAEHVREGDGVFTKPLLEQMGRTLNLGEQVILFLNRRGFAPYVFCRDCGHSYRCDACDVSLTLHQRRGMLCCHYCGFEMPAPDTCSACNSHRVGAQGVGTEKVQAEVHALFQGVKTLRLDRDVVRKKSDLEQLLGRFRRHEAQVLIGTQMVAKGHDFPGVTLVGVVSADASLNFPDFRASERTFQLLTQVAGRAGRGELKGQVLVQAYETQHYAIEAALTHDYDKFVSTELQMREELGYPPFTHLALLRFEGPHESTTKQHATTVANFLRERLAQSQQNIKVLGPAAAPLSRLRDMYRFQVLLKAEKRSALRQVLRHIKQTRHQQVHQIFDVDPVHML